MGLVAERGCGVGGRRTESCGRKRKERPGEVGGKLSAVLVWFWFGCCLLVCCQVLVKFQLVLTDQVKGGKQGQSCVLEGERAV